MNLEAISIKEIVSAWQIRVENLKIIRNSEKKLIEIESSDGQLYMLKGERHRNDVLNEICAFANELTTILPFTTYIQTEMCTYMHYYKGFSYTLEQKINGREYEYVTDAMISSIASSLGKMHQFSLQQNRRLHQATSWSMFGGNATDKIGDYDENELSYIELKSAFPNEEEMLEIIDSYNSHRAKLKAKWSALPKAATQGDFCYNNMLFNEDGQITGIFDFNIAGDEILLNECIAVAIYHCWHVAYKGETTPEDRFQLFLETYQRERQFKALEIEISPYLFAIIRAFRYDRIEDGIKDTENITRFLIETLQLLKCEV